MTFRFGSHFTITYAPGLDAILDVTAKDTDGEVFTAWYGPHWL